MNDDHANPGRGRWLCGPYVLLSPISIVLLVLTLVGVGTLPVTVGVLILTLVVPATRRLANLYRRQAAIILGEPVPAPYRDGEPDNWPARLWFRARDPQSWRDVLWLLCVSTGGLALSTASAALFLSVPWYLIQPFLVWVTPEGTFDTNYGIVEVNSVATSFYQYGLAVLAAVLWWYGAPRLMRLHALIERGLLGPTKPARVRMLEQRVTELAESRSEAVDVQAAELRRIERDLHDGAQARIVSSGMTLGMALELLDTDPDAAKGMLREAHSTTLDALQDLRLVVRGIHPPVLSDRGLVGAVQALAIQMPIPVHVTTTLPGRPPAPVESAVYFAVAECLANIGKHADASTASIAIDYSSDEQALHVIVADDGDGGATIDPDGGLAGIERRLDVFDGTLAISSPAGGPTEVAMMVPCELSSEKT